MSHIHLPDGVLPVSWWLLGYIAALIWLTMALRRAETEEVRRKLPYLAGMSALMLLTMSIPLGPLPVHLNLTVLTGIVLGPWLGFVSVFVVNIMLSFLGHGGLTAVGVNSLITGLEVVLGWWFYYRLLSSWRLNWRAVVATGMTLLLTSGLALAVIGFGTGVIHLEWHTHVPGQYDGHDYVAEQATTTGQVNTDAATGFLGLGGVAAFGLILACGLVIEAIATWGITSYLYKVGPQLLEDSNS